MALRFFLQHLSHLHYQKKPTLAHAVFHFLDSQMNLRLAPKMRILCIVSPSHLDQLFIPWLQISATTPLLIETICLVFSCMIHTYTHTADLLDISFISFKKHLVPRPFCILKGIVQAIFPNTVTFPPPALAILRSFMEHFVHSCFLMSNKMDGSEWPGRKLTMDLLTAAFSFSGHFGLLPLLF